ARRRGGERALEAAHARAADDRPHGRRTRQPARGHPRSLHRTHGARARPARVAVRLAARVRRRRALRQGGRDQLPARAPRSAHAAVGAGRRHGLQGVDRQRRSRAGSAGVATLRLRPRRRGYDPPRAHREHVGARRPARVDGVARGGRIVVAGGGRRGGPGGPPPRGPAGRPPPPPITAKAILFGSGPRFARDAFGPVLAFYVLWKLWGLVPGVVAATAVALLVYRYERQQDRPGLVVRVALRVGLIQAAGG